MELYITTTMLGSVLCTISSPRTLCYASGKTGDADNFPISWKPALPPEPKLPAYEINLLTQNVICKYDPVLIRIEKIHRNNTQIHYCGNLVELQGHDPSDSCIRVASVFPQGKPLVFFFHPLSLFSRWCTRGLTWWLAKQCYIIALKRNGHTKWTNDLLRVCLSSYG